MVTLLVKQFLSTLSLRRATYAQARTCILCEISIHALLAESDRRQTRQRPRNRDFYPRSPCGERPGYLRNSITHKVFLSTLSLRRATGKSNKLAGLKLVFLSTLSLRRATAITFSSGVSSLYFYPRSPCGERLAKVRHCEGYINISIHALLAESDPAGS